jgi:hypothetical protein
LEEVESLKQYYGEYAKWGSDKGILKALIDLFKIHNPTLEALRTMANVLSARLELPLGRQEKRRKFLLVGWFNKNFPLIEPLLPNLVIIDDSGTAIGPYTARWHKFAEEEPTSIVMQYIKGELEAPIDT